MKLSKVGATGIILLVATLASAQDIRSNWQMWTDTESAGLTQVRSGKNDTVKLDFECEPRPWGYTRHTDIAPVHYRARLSVQLAEDVWQELRQSDLIQVNGWAHALSQDNDYAVIGGDGLRVNVATTGFVARWAEFVAYCSSL